MKYLTSLLICFITFHAFGQADYQPQKNAPDKLRNDFLLLRDTLQKVHPALYRYKNKEDIDRIFDSCLAMIRDSMAVTDFYALTSFAIASIEDGHTNCRLPGQVMRDFVNSKKLFPALVMFIQNKAFIFCCRQKEELKGAELLSIDHHAMDGIIQNLFNYISSDGGIPSRKNWDLAENFPILYNILYGDKSSFSITYKTKSGDIKTVTLQADLIKNVTCGNPFPKPVKYLQLQYLPDGITLLTIKTFFNGYLEQSGENFKTFLDSAFQDMNQKQVKKLLIDVRGNPGGHDSNGVLLYSFLAQKPFQYFVSESTVNEIVTEQDPGHPNLGIKQPREHPFKGKVYFLMDGRSFSTTADFCAVAKRNKRGLFFGEETGGGYYGNTSGSEIEVVLPNTQLHCRIPKVKYVSTTEEPVTSWKGVIPDVLVYITIDDLVNHQDGQLHDVLQKIAYD